MKPFPYLISGLLRSSRHNKSQNHGFGLLTVAENYQNTYVLASASTASTKLFSTSTMASQSKFSPSAAEANLEAGFFKPDLVIFDKDGTLVCFHTMWTPWCRNFAVRMNEATGKEIVFIEDYANANDLDAGVDISDHVYEVLGYDEKEKKVRIGALAENTHPQIRDKIEEMLTTNSLKKLSPKDAKEVLDDTWQDTPEDMDIKLTANLANLFRRLKSENVKVRIKSVVAIVSTVSMHFLRLVSQVFRHFSSFSLKSVTKIFRSAFRKQRPIFLVLP